MLKKVFKGMSIKSQGISFIVGFVISSLLFGTMAFASQGEQMINVMYDNIKIVIDGKPIPTTDAQGNSVEPFIYNGRTYLPVRAVAEAVGKTVTWDGKTSTVYLGKTDGQTPVDNLTNLPVFKGDKLDFGSQVYTDNTGVVHQPADIVNNFSGHYYSGTYLLNMKYSRLKGNVSLLDRDKNTSEKLCLNIYGDNKLLYTSAVITAGAYPQDFDVDVSGVVQLRLAVTGDNIYEHTFVILSGLDLYN